MILCKYSVSLSIELYCKVAGIYVNITYPRTDLNSHKFSTCTFTLSQILTSLFVSSIIAVDNQGKNGLRWKSPTVPTRLLIRLVSECYSNEADFKQQINLNYPNWSSYRSRTVLAVSDPLVCDRPDLVTTNNASDKHGSRN